MGDAVADVILLDVPVPLWAKAREQLDRALAELPSDEGPPARVAELLRCLREEYSVVAETADAELRAGSVRRAESIDVAYAMPRRGRNDVAALLDALEDLDTYARKAGRKDLVRTADTRSFWRWYLGEIVKQCDDGFPAPWPGD